MKLRFSTLVHRFEKDGIVAFYNSLKMRPLFVEKKLSQKIDEMFKHPVDTSDLANIAKDKTISNDLIDNLKEFKIIINESVDEKRIIKSCLEQATKQQLISNLYLVLTENCNLGCQYCLIMNRLNKSYKKTDMAKDTVCRALDLFSDCCLNNPESFDGEKRIIFYGGEPLLNFSVMEKALDKISSMKQKHYLPQGLLMLMITNGTMMSKKIAEKLLFHNVSVAVSIDGDQFSHDSFRIYKNKQPSFQDALNGLRICQKLGMNPGISCTLNIETIRNFPRVIETIVNEIGVDHLGFNIMISGGACKPDFNYWVEASQKIIDAFKVFRKLGIREDRMFRKVDAFVKGRIYPFDCAGAGGNQMVIAPDGHLGICQGYLGSRKYFEFNVNESNADPLQTATFKEWRLRTPFSIAECHNCFVLGICGGGCPMHAEEQNNSIWKLDDRFCVHSKMTLEWLIWDLFDQITNNEQKNK